MPLLASVLDPRHEMRGQFPSGNTVPRDQRDLHIQATYQRPHVQDGRVLRPAGHEAGDSGQGKSTSENLQGGAGREGCWCFPGSSSTDLTRRRQVRTVVQDGTTLSRLQSMRNISRLSKPEGKAAAESVQWVMDTTSLEREQEAKTGQPPDNLGLRTKAAASPLCCLGNSLRFRVFSWWGLPQRRSNLRVSLWVALETGSVREATEK